MSPTLELDKIPADHDRFGPMAIAEATDRSYLAGLASTLRWAHNDDNDLIQYVLGHHEADALERDLRKSGLRLQEVIAQGWEVGYRHAFACVDPINGCTCPVDAYPVATVPEGTPNSYPVTAVLIEETS